MRVVAVDTNLLVLLVVGTNAPNAIETHKRLKAYSADDYDLLTALLQDADITATPNVLTEVSNLVGQGMKEPWKTEVFQILAELIDQIGECHQASALVSREPEFDRLGLADCAWFEILETGAELLTDDLDLYLASLNRGLTASNFNHKRVEYGLL